MIRIIIIINLLLVDTSKCELDDFVLPKYSTALSRAVVDYVLNFYYNTSTTVNMYDVVKPENFDVNFDIVNEVLYNVETKVVVQVDNTFDFKITSWMRVNNIIFVDSFKSFMKIYRRIEYVHFEFQGYYLVVVTQYSVKNPIYDTMDKIFAALWKKKIVNANVIFMPQGNPNDALVFTYYPYSYYYCEDVIPIHLNHYKDNQWLHEIDYFPKKLTNFHGCKIRVATFNSPPFMMVSQDQNGSYKVEGVEGTLLRVLAQKLNFTLHIISPKNQWGYISKNKTYSGSIKLVVKKKVNLTLGFYASLPDRNEAMQPSHTYYTTNLVWMVPPGHPYTALEKLENPLDTTVWILSGVTVLVGFIVIAVLTKSSKTVQNFVFGRKIQAPALNLINVVLGNSLHRLPMRNFSRFLLMLAIIHFFIIRTCYTGGLVQYMQKNTRRPHMMATKQLLANNFSFYMNQAARIYVSQIPEVLARTKIIENNAYRLYVKEMINDPDYKGAFLTTVSHMAYRNFKVFPHSFYEYTPKPIYTISIVIYMNHGSCLEDPLNNLIIQFLSCGLMSKWTSEFIDFKYLKKPVNDSPKVLSLVQMEGVFNLFLVGHLVSLVVFCGEIFIKCSCLGKIKKIKNIEFSSKNTIRKLK